MQEKHAIAREVYRPVLWSPSQVITMLNRTEKHENKELGKAQHEPCVMCPMNNVTLE